MNLRAGMIGLCAAALFASPTVASAEVGVKGAGVALEARSVPGLEPTTGADAGSPVAAKRPRAETSPKLAEHAVSAVLMDAATGTVLMEKNSHEKLPPASITKIMTMLLTVEALERGQVQLSDRIRTSERAASMGGSQIFLEPGEEMTLDDMMKGIAVASANDASVAVAEYLAGSEAEFVSLMNRRAEELGMRDTHFVNCNGLPAEGHYTSAYDIAIMSRELLKHPQVLRWTSLYEDYLRKNTDRPFWLVNTNKLVRYYPGVDGLKTGFTGSARYCLSATAKKGDFRVIAVVMGEPTSKQRNAEVTQMLDWAFGQYQFVKLYGPGDPVGQVRLDKGDPEKAPVTVRQSVGVLLRRGESKTGIRARVVVSPGAAPKKKGALVGKVVVYRDDQPVSAAPLYLAKDVRRAGWWAMFGRTCRHWLGASDR
ncbi:D-alanyl-D-alanine carboxypeptidase family protein [Kyrpidia spormannii]|uniref:D-alanyl-D-alanine carboxypeptidase (Penicilin binding protein) n=2 Tax=Kyrpidia spormannii TaxID=2055160 RepID=A0ACA8ZBC0_9BACL|nr:D-alanyl-D-alanine carboxypeptidase family protein [Kyrpidia spormannii]CAB3392816.1 D-alanyl-D-alanine carboxypeptidase (penicilin binding protein) [Kyrpidia spormannii]CAB3393728.1 D-alanyl-D-alanine carboxypeptidase (penicilin binding protein) [Kyrpidia spormannii]